MSGARGANEQSSKEQSSKAAYEEDALETLRGLETEPSKDSNFSSIQRDDSRKKMFAIETNVYEVETKFPVTLYKYQLVVAGFTMKSNERIVFTERSKSEFFGPVQSAALSSLFDLLVEMNVGHFGVRSTIFYDLHKTFYTTKSLPETPTRFDVEIDIEEGDMPMGLYRYRGCLKFSIEVEFVESLSNSLFCETANFDSIETLNVGMRKAIDVAMLQDVILDEDLTLPNHSSTYYMSDIDVDIAESSGPFFYSATGVKRSPKVIEGEFKQRSAATVGIFIKPIVSTFYPTERTCDELVRHTKYRQTIADILVGLYVRIKHRSGHMGEWIVRRIAGIGQSASAQVFLRDNEMISVEDYFQEQYKIELKYPDLPVIVCKGRNGSNEFYPLELCEVAGDMKVRQEALNSTGFLDRIMKLARYAPVAFFSKVRNALKRTKLSVSGFFEEAGLLVRTVPIKFRVPLMVAPKICYARKNEVALNTLKNNWISSGQYVVTRNIRRWGLYAINSRRSTGTPFNMQNLKAFEKEILRVARQKGIFIEEAFHTEIIGVEDHWHYTLESKMKEASNGEGEFIMILTERDAELHNRLKLYEQRFDLATQNVLKKTALACIGTPPARVTLENLVNKMNVKLGGINYELKGAKNEVLGENELFIGFTVDRGFGKQPTIIGYTANDLKTPIAFSGNFVYHVPLANAKLSSYKSMVEEIIRRWKKNRSCVPARIFIFVSGHSDGDFEKIVKYEVQLFRAVIEKQFDKPVPLVVISVSKGHMLRAMPEHVSSKSIKDQNVVPGALIDQHVTKPAFNEFYMYSSIVPQGTACPARYNVVYSDVGINIGQIEDKCYALCFAHQIINMPTSVPSPVYISREFAKRARNNFKAYLDDGGELRDYSDLDEEISYKDKSLRDQRFNA